MHAGTLGTVSGLDAYRGHSAGQAPRETRACHRPCDSKRITDDATTAALRYRRTERTALYIETQEGDIVRLRIKVRDALSGSIRGSGTEESPVDISVTSRNSLKISFSVDGDLNADELAAIRSVVEQAGALAADFFDGDLPQAFATAAALDIDATQLARVGLKLSVRERLTYADTYAPTPVTPERPAPAAAPTPTAAPAEVATAPAADGAPAATAAATGDEPVVGAEPAVTEEAPDPQTPAAAPPAVATQVLATIADFLAQLLDALAAPPAVEDTPASVSLDLSLKLRIYRAVLVDLSAARPADGDPAAQALPVVGETLDALAAAQQPVDTRA